MLIKFNKNDTEILENNFSNESIKYLRTRYKLTEVEANKIYWNWRKKYVSDFKENFNNNKRKYSKYGG